jgi:hypothetical protein
MKFYRLTLIALLCTLVQSCNSPLVNKTLGAPARLIQSVTGPILGPVLGR